MSPVVVGISEIRFAKRPERLVTYGLGSCVAVVIFSAAEGLAAMAHVMLPMVYTQDAEAPPGKYADLAVANMVREFAKRGLDASALAAKMAGGADMFAGIGAGPGRHIGARNALSARKALDNHRIPLVGEDIGGGKGRTAEFLTMTGALVVRTLKAGTMEI